MVLCKKHVTDNLSHKIKNDFLVKLLKGLTTCKKQDKFFAKNNIILVLDYFSDCNANEKRYVSPIMPFIFNNIVLPLNKICKSDTTLPCACKPSSNNLAESANLKKKKLCKFQKEHLKKLLTVSKV